MWVLDEHRTREGNAAILPGTGYIELIAEALKSRKATGFNEDDFDEIETEEIPVMNESQS